MNMTREQLQPTRPLLTPVPPPGEEQRVEAVLEMARQHLGFVPDGLRLYSFSPPLLENFFSNVGYFLNGTSLSPLLTTMIRYLVSAGAHCQFCIDLNEGFLDQMGVDLDTARAARANPALAPVTEAEHALLDIALRAVTDPEGVDATAIEAARAQGWSDREIFDAAAQAVNNRAFNFMLRTFNIEQQGAYA